MVRKGTASPGLHTTVVGTLNPAPLAHNLKTAEQGPLSADVYTEAKRHLANAGESPQDYRFRSTSARDAPQRFTPFIVQTHTKEFSMILTTDRYMIRSRNVNIYYWEQGVYPDWTALNTLMHFPDGLTGTGVEPHYHDNDEIWLFTAGRGEVLLDGVRYDITPNTLVYTPMGVVHRFQMFTPYENNAIVTPLERAKRATHILVDEDGPPEPTVPGFVIPGAQNNGPIANPGSRCPLSEWRQQKFAPGEVIPEARLATNEHWQVINGTLLLTLDGQEIELAPHDVALLRAGTVRSLRSPDGARVTVVRER